MPLELSLTFPDPDHVQVELLDDGYNEPAGTHHFVPPLDQKTREELTWYLEIYPVHYTAEPDDARAADIAKKLREWGGLLFRSAFADLAAHALYVKFKGRRDPGRLLTVRSLHPMVLAQPWELLCDPNGTFVYLDHPHISIRRRLFGPGETPYRPQPKDTLNLLFVVSRPDGPGFIDTRADPMAVMDAIDAEAPGRITVEFLRPPTLPKLIDRLNDDRLPPVDILHFDGHGAYAPDGRSRQTLVDSGLAKNAPGQAHQGYLLFEDDAHKPSPVPASTLGDLLQRKHVGLVILSACRSAMVSGEDALGSVAPRLLQAGIPSVLAMTQSVLVATTRALGRHLYRELAIGRPIGTALDLARTKLYAEPRRGRRQRASGTIDIELQDWFVPALYQAGADGALLTRSEAKTAPPAVPTHNLNEPHEDGFHGRTRELHNIERWFVGDTRRIVISGFGGQGKTALAQEAGRWLLRTGLFDRVCFVSYEGLQGIDGVQLAVSTLASVLGANLIDADGAQAALRETPTLLILDNLDSLSVEARAELLTAASAWSKQGRSRVLITARSGDLGHKDYPAEGSNLCRHLELAGLAPQDALKWFDKLLTLPPEPARPIPTPGAIQELFAQVAFHPLSISVLTPVLKRQRIADVAEALRTQLLKTDDPLLASLNLSLERLDAESQEALSGLGVFVATGAMEPAVITLLGLDEPRWRPLRDALHQAKLVVIETTSLLNSVFIRFHPTLVPAMRLRLSPETFARLRVRYRDYYYNLSDDLYEKLRKRQRQEAVQWVAWRELPNLFEAACAELESGEPSTGRFVTIVAHFLAFFGLRRDSNALIARAAASAPTPGSEDWRLLQSARGEQLFRQTEYIPAEAIFDEILRYLGDIPSYNRSWTLLMLARCKKSQGQLEPAEAVLRQALDETKTLPLDREIRNFVAAIHADLGDLLVDRGDLDNAQVELEAAFAIGKDLGDTSNIAAVSGSLAKMSLKRPDLPRAERYALAERYARDALAEFERLSDRNNMAIGYNNLGIIHLEARALSEAETDFREAGRLSDSLGDWTGAATAWMNLANVCLLQDQPITVVERWYHKALRDFDRANDKISKATTLDNLAKLLLRDGARSTEAREWAEQALTIRQEVGSDASTIRKTYELLALIALQQGDRVAVGNYAAELRRIQPDLLPEGEGLRFAKSLIADMLAALRRPAERPAVEQKLSAFGSGSDLGDALRALLSGERDEAVLSARLDAGGLMMVRLILSCLADPETERRFFSTPDGHSPQLGPA